MNNIPFYSCTTICLSIHLLKSIQYPGCFQFLTTITKATINICVRVFEQQKLSNQLVKYEGAPVLDLMENVYSVLKTTVKPKWLNHFAWTPILNENSYGSATLSAFGSVSLNFGHFNSYVMKTHFYFNCMSLIKMVWIVFPYGYLLPVYFIWWNVYINFVYFKLFIFLFLNSWVFNVLHCAYFGYRSFIIHVLYKHFHVDEMVDGLFILLRVTFTQLVFFFFLLCFVFNVSKVQLIYFSFHESHFGLVQVSSANLRQQRCSPRSCIGLHLTFKSIVHFELFVV